MERRAVLAAALVAAAALAACGGPENAEEPAPVVGAAEAPAPPPPVPPAIIAPDETADPAEPPSYEVAIASAAAERNKSIERCAAQPESVRTQCEQEANAAFAESERALQDLRGNQQ
jgi:hypothetical protein